MEEIYDDVKYRDITFRLDSGLVFGAHRVVLANSGVEWFENLLSERFSDASLDVVEVHEVSDLSFEIILKWCYNIKRKVISLEELAHYFHAANMFMQPKLIKKITKADAVNVDSFKLELAKYYRQYRPTYSQLMFRSTIEWNYCIEQFRAEKVDIDTLRYVLFGTEDNPFLRMQHALPIGIISWFKTKFDGRPKPSIEYRDVTLKLLDNWMRAKEYQLVYPKDYAWLNLLAEEGYLHDNDWKRANDRAGCSCNIVAGEPIRLGKLLGLGWTTTSHKILGEYAAYKGSDEITHYIVEL